MARRRPELYLKEDLVLDFFYVFSRFEYALKRTGFAKKQGRDGVAADWDAFAIEIENRGPDLEKVLTAGRYILKSPPNKQILEGRELSWKPARPTQSPIQDLLIYVRRVRNNLFHGGKYPAGPEPDTARDEDLLRASIAVLDAVLGLSCSLELRGNFEWDG